MRYYGRLTIIISLVSVFYGCSIATRVAYEDSEGELSDDFFSLIHRGKTDTAWVLSQLGEPEHIEMLGNEAETYTWKLSYAAYTHASLFFVLRYNTVEREEEFFHVISQNGVVKKHWRDQLSRIQEHITKKFVSSSGKLMNEKMDESMEVEVDPRMDEPVDTQVGTQVGTEAVTVVVDDTDI